MFSRQWPSSIYKYSAVRLKLFPKKCWCIQMMKNKILVVEDEKIVAKDIESTLTAIGYDVVGLAESYDEAISIFEKTDPDLVLMDIKIKGKKDGLDVAKHISTHNKKPIVFLTSYSDEESLKRAKTCESYGYLLKPYDERSLKNTIELSLARSAESEKLTTEKDDYKKLYKASKTMPNMDLDLFDRRILGLLDDNARMSASEIGKCIRLPKETINYRIKRLIRDGYIKNFEALIDVTRLGMFYYQIFLKFQKITPKIEKDLVEYLHKNPEVLNLQMMQGGHDVSIMVAYSSPIKVRELMSGMERLMGDHISSKNIHVMISLHKLQQKYLLPGKQYNRKSMLFSGHPVLYVPDEIEIKIIRLLSADARMKLVDVAKEVGQDSRVVQYHIKKLEKNGVICGYTTILDQTKFDDVHAHMYIKVKDSEKIMSIIEYFDNTNALLYAYEYLGDYDLSLCLHVENMERLNSLLEKFKEDFNSHYVSMDVANVYKDYKINPISYVPDDATKNTKKKPRA